MLGYGVGLLLVKGFCWLMILQVWLTGFGSLGLVGFLVFRLWLGPFFVVLILALVLGLTAGS